jgi:hypothetical protein
VAQQTRLDHPGVVEDQQVTRREQPGQRAKDMVGTGQLPTVQQARAAAIGARVLGDQGRWQREVEIV